MSQIFNIVEELEKERKKNKELENIIDELAKWLIIKSKDYYKYTKYDEVLDKLIELRGDNK